VTTLREVADRSGVSTATVSYVLNNTRYVSPVLRSKVLAAVQETGYRPNSLARSLRCKRTHTLGLIVSDVVNPFFTEVARGAEDKASQLGFSIVLCNSDEDVGKEQHYVELLLDKQIDGLIIAPSPGEHSFLEPLRSSGFPTVLVNRSLPGFSLTTIMVDNERATYDATEHLISHGHSDIAALLSLPGSRLTAERQLGYESALRDHGLEVRFDLMVNGLSTVEGGAEASKALMSRSNPPTAIISMSTLMTLGALRAFKEMGVKCPEQVALVGFGEAIWSSVTDPPLTAIAQPAKAIGAGAVDLVEGLISSPPSGRPELRVMPCELIIRRSCGCQ